MTRSKDDGRIWQRKNGRPKKNHNASMTLLLPDENHELSYLDKSGCIWCSRSINRLRNQAWDRDLITSCKHLSSGDLSLAIDTDPQPTLIP